MRIRHKYLFSVVLAAILNWGTVGTTTAQPTHVEALQNLGIRCIGDLPVDMDSFRLDGDQRAAYVRSGLFAFWTERGKQIFASDSTRSGSPLPRLTYRINQIAIELSRVTSDRVERQAQLGLSYRLSGPDGQILADNTCSESASDTLSTDLANLFADPRYAETNIHVQHRGWFKRYLEPAVIVGAAAIGTYLFFNLRSRRSDDG